MATILKRKKKYSVVYYYEDEKGEKNKSGKHIIPTPKPKREKLK